MSCSFEQWIAASDVVLLAMTGVLSIFKGEQIVTIARFALRAHCNDGGLTGFGATFPLPDIIIAHLKKRLQA